MAIVAVVVGPGIGTDVGAILAYSGVTVYVTKIDPRYRRCFKDNFPGVKNAPSSLRNVDILVSFNEKITHRLMEWYSPTLIITTPRYSDDVKQKYSWVSFDLNCSYYGVPQSRIQPFFVGVRGNNSSEIVWKIKTDVGAYASRNQTVAGDVINTKTYMLHPYNGRSLYKASLPAPTINKKHWPIVSEFKPCIADAKVAPKGVRSLRIEEVAALHGIDIPLLYLSRKDAFCAICNSVPPPVFSVVMRISIGHLWG